MALGVGKAVLFSRGELDCSDFLMCNQCPHGAESLAHFPNDSSLFNCYSCKKVFGVKVSPELQQIRAGRGASADQCSGENKGTFKKG